MVSLWDHGMVLQAPEMYAGQLDMAGGAILGSR